MSTRGRSRTVSPIALAATRPDAALTAHLELGFVAKAHLAKLNPLARAPTPTPSRCASPDSRPHSDLYTIPAQPVASSSRLDPCPPFSCSQSSTSSTSSDRTPAPITPPALAVDLYPARYRSPSFDYYESPPSPPRTLQDQMHVAYAHDNMHLAKILLLKLQGIEVTDDKDPRIDQVKDEDFTSTFVPRGGLVMDAERERLCMERQRREEERRRRREREERLKACEHIWENSSRALQAEKTKTARRKEAAACVRRRLDMEVRERERVKQREREELSRPTRPVRFSSGTPRPVLSYDKLPALRTRAQPSTSRSPPKPAYDGPLFDYPYLSAAAPTRISPPAFRSTKSTEGPYRELSTLTARGVAFREVVASMHGPLFPVASDDEAPRKAKDIKQRELLKSLLQPATWDLHEEGPGQRGSPLKGKARARVEDDLPTFSLIPASLSSSLTSTSTTTSIYRSTSWFSFGSRASVTTAITTPSSSLMSYAKSYFPATSSPHDLDRTAGQHARHMHTPRTLSTSVAPSETPLGDVRNPTRAQAQPCDDGLFPVRGRMLTRGGSSGAASPSAASTASSSSSLVARVTRSVSTFVDMAAQFQRAYVKATAYTASPDIYFSSPSSSTYGRSRSRSRIVERRSRTPHPRPQGYRASSDDVENVCRAELAVPDVREKVVGVAWEGIGRSGLVREVKPAA
ncbi:hypothetical protein PHLGIDRAFT_114308 [Phlebiopsis gigantea 11061_1 CR5-6]|uniref:Uncharacterized protein n=1 Tax=Phlebiopsis gigantea (strain 11061_1 CR5-6) TaxID=745531 RepID=A0A0C3S6A3_PHLG1|nr:hypothetical protein PHLGIDRAFT_114308 [Phlebiopsis gigantea 11061_1 CR5-6]